jgi:MFS family permease
MWSAELVANAFLGPPLGAFLISLSFALPFFVDAGSFAAAAGLVFLIAGQYRAPEVVERQPWKTELVQGVRWLRGHELLWPMAVILGLLNAMGTMTMATLVLFGQEVLHTSARTFALLTIGAAIGGVIGSLAAPRTSRRLGSGPTLGLTMVGGAVGSALLLVTSSWQVAAAGFAIEAGLGSMWNVITVSLRQAVIPDHLLGRVNSVYRFLAWGMMPIGSVVGGLVVAVADTFVSRSIALRVPYLVVLVGNLVLLAFASRKLTTARIEAVRAAGKVESPGAVLAAE